MTFSPITGKLPYAAIKPRAATLHLAGFQEFPELRKSSYVRTFLSVGQRRVPVVASRLSLRDRWGAVRMRLGMGRNAYRVMPGLYAIGEPTRESEILVTANYKLSFDYLRRELSGVSAWIIALDTKGVNVWCAAGKGTFGTAELLSKIRDLNLGEISARRELVLPQLGASGVSSHEVSRSSGYKVIYGPVRARDVPAFLASGHKKDAAMSLVSFTLRERLAVAPLELIHAWPFVLASLALSLLAFFAGGKDLVTARNLLVGTFGALLVGTIGFQALLPYLPTRSFAVKGAVLGALWGLVWAVTTGVGWALGLGVGALSAALVSFTGLNFTGCSTYTSPAGAAYEVKASIPPIVIGAAVGLALTLIALLLPR